MGVLGRVRGGGSSICGGVGVGEGGSSKVGGVVSVGDDGLLTVGLVGGKVYMQRCHGWVGKGFEGNVHGEEARGENLGESGGFTIREMSINVET